MQRVWLSVLAGCGRVGFDTQAPADADPASDAAPSDAGFDWCEGVRADTVALYTFELPTVGADATGVHPGAVWDSAASFASPCGQGIVIGASNALSTEGNPDPPTTDSFVNGVLGQVRLSSTWRDFGSR